ncbi:MAG: cytochrome c [Desulfobacterales bacterium]|jgi:cytochrome c556
MKKVLMILVGLVFIAGVIGGAYAQFAKPEYAIKYRKAVMFLIAQHFGRMGAMVKEKMPYNQEVFTRNAMLVETLSHLPWEASMVPGTDTGDTTLNASVFAQQSKFEEVAQAFEAQATKLASVAQSGDFSAIKTQFGEVGKSCKACHTRFRTK